MLLKLLITTARNEIEGWWKENQMANNLKYIKLHFLCLVHKLRKFIFFTLDSRSLKTFTKNFTRKSCGTTNLA